MTVGQQIAAVARVHLGVDREAQRLALAILSAVHIPDPQRRMNAFPHEMCGGMAQRIVIAIALICKPVFVIPMMRPAVWMSRCKPRSWTLMGGFAPRRQRIAVHHP